MQIPFHTSCGTIDLAALGAGDFWAPMIAESLSKINRFSGHVRQPWSVASHCLLVEALCRSDFRRGWALLHDAHKAFIGDITTPALDLICDSGTRSAVLNAWGNAKGRIDRAMGAAWNCVPQPMSLEIRRADWIALQAEQLCFFEQKPEAEVQEDLNDIHRGVDLIKGLPKGSDWKWAKDAWLKRAHELETAGQLKLPDYSNPSSTPLAG